MQRGFHHGLLDPGPRLSKDYVCLTAREGAGVQSFRPALRLFCPNDRVLSRRQVLQAVEQPFGQPGPGLWLEFQCGGLKLFDHGLNSTSRCFRFTLSARVRTRIQ